MKEDRLIIHYSRDNKILAVYNTVNEAVFDTGIERGFIISNLTRGMHDCPDGTKFRYEVKATDLRKKRIEEEKKKEQKKIEEFWR